MKRVILIFVSVFLLSQLQAREQKWVQRVEPTFWWTEMNQSEFQLMVYGADLRSADISMNYPGVTISRKEITDNPDYVFLYLNVSKEASPGKIKIMFRKDKKTQTVMYELKKRREGSASRKSFTQAVLPTGIRQMIPLQVIIRGCTGMCRAHAMGVTLMGL